MLADAGDLIFKESLVRLVEAMDAPTAEAFNKLLESDASEAEIMAFLSEKVPGAEAIVGEAVDEVRDAILAETPNE